MKTYQDLLAVGELEKDRMEFIEAAIKDHQNSDFYRVARDADLYYKHLNPTIMRAQKFIYDTLGQPHIDRWSPNHKVPSRYFFYFVNQTVQTLLGNGVTFKLDKKTKDLFTDDFDEQVQKTATRAVVCGVGYGYLNREETEAGQPGKYSIQIFDPLSFVPLRDEENGSLRAGIKYWQLESKNNDKPLQAILYEENGYTTYIRRKGEDWAILVEKQHYIKIVASSDVGGSQVVDGRNYPGFPIVPLWNINEQSDLVGSQETLDDYDLTASRLVNNSEMGDLTYWVIQNAGGMTETDAAKFIRQIHSAHVALVEGEEQVTPHQIQAPVQATQSALETLRNQLYDDFMAFDPKTIASGAVTATQIKAAYEPLNNKLDLFEYHVTAFILGILKLLGVEDQPTYTRSMIVNQQETVTNLVAAQTVLPQEYIARKIVEVLGDVDDADDVVKMLAGEDMGRFDNGNPDGENPDGEE